MRCYLLLAAVVFLAINPVLAQTTRVPAKEQAAIVELAQKAAVRSLTFSQGNVESLMGARHYFTPEGWSEFMKQMNGFLDEKGAPTFSSAFVPSGDPVIVGQENGVIHTKIPGKLTQTHNKSQTTYNHAILDIKAGGKPIKIAYLNQIYVAH